jgi:uncharacterized membrane protein YgdD (TMEM256/DUF423 family)
MNSRSCFLIAAAFAFLAVALGAFGAHGLKAVLEPSQLVTFETGVRYQFYHAIALFIVGVLMIHTETYTLLKQAGALFSIGIILFSGSLYALACADILGVPRIVGMITPLGGLCFMAGWASLFLSQWKRV